jgi:hypothetical protein
MYDLKTYPYSYRAFSLNIVSRIPVTGFETAPVDIPDVFIMEGNVPEAIQNAVNKGVLFQSSETEFLLTVDRVARYYVHNGNEIVIQRTGEVPLSEISAFLIGTAFGALFHQRRQLPLHACTVLYENKCLLFAGMSGAGKSTLAAALIKNGGTLIADDISVIDYSGEKPAVCPAFPVIKIWEDSLKHLGMTSNGLEPVRGELKKFYLPITQFSQNYTAINHIFILNTHNRPEMEVKPLQGVDKFRVLKKHTYLFRGIPKTGLEQNHFILSNRLATQVPVTILTRPNGDFNTNRLISKVSELISAH